MISAHYAPLPIHIGQIKRPTDDDLRLKPRRQVHHPKDFESVYVSRVPWSELTKDESESNVSFREIGAEMRGWEHEVEP